MREFNEDGSLKDMTALLTEYGFAVAQLVERKGDRMRCIIEKVEGHQVKLSLEGTPDVYIVVPLAEFADKKWVIKRVNEQTAVSITPRPNANACESMQVARYRALIQSELYNLTITHEDVVQHLRICIKPVKGVMCTKSFAKGKLTLVPTSMKVMSKSGEVPKSAVVVGTPYHAASFWLTNVPLPKSADDDIAVAFWFLGRGDEDKQNMEIVMLKCAGGLVFPVARNHKTIRSGEFLCLPKLDDGSGTSAAVAGAPKKKARTS